MRILKYISIISGLILLSSCQEELVYDPFETSQNGMGRYLSEIKETTYLNTGISQQETTSVLFNNPEYDKYGKINFAYNNFTGYEANDTYLYSTDEIVTIANRKNGEVIRRKYTLQNNIVISCLETTNLNNNIKNYQYSYDSIDLLVKIEVYDEEYDSRSEIFIEWEATNILSVEVKLQSGYTSRYDFKYTEKNRCDPNIPFFFTSCYEIGGTYGIDEILSMQNYFGTSISKYLPNEVYFNDKISRVFKYEIGKDGSLSKINQISTDNSKTIRTYSFRWM